MVRKITLSRALRIMQNLFPEEYNFYPRSWILPEEFQLFVAQVDSTPGLWRLNDKYACDCSCVAGPVCWELGQGGTRRLSDLLVHCEYWQPLRKLAVWNRQGNR